MLTAENIYFLSIYLLTGMLTVMIIFNSFIWYSTRDKVIGYHLLYMIAAMGMIANKLIAISGGQYYESFSRDSWSDNLISTILAIPYTFFCYEGFNVRNGTRLLRYSWNQIFILNSFHLVIVVIVGIAGVKDYQKTPAGGILLMIIFAATLFLIFNALLIKNKNRFQKFLISGVIFFTAMLLFAALQENYYKSPIINGRSGFFLAIAGEMLFFALASAQRIKDIFGEAEQMKTGVYKQQLETEQVINYFTASISDKNNIDDLMWDVVKNCISKLGFEDCVIYLADDEQKILVQKAAWGPKTKEDNKITNPLKIPFGTGIVGHVARNDKAEIIPDTTLDKRYITDDASRPSEISVPISYNGKVLGVIDSEHSQKYFYTERHLHLLTTIATLLAERIVKIRAEQSAKEKEIEILTMRAINYQYQLEVEQVTHFFSQTISQKETVDEMLWDVSKNLIGKLGFEDCMIYLWNDDKTMLLQKAGYGPKGAMLLEADKNKYHVPKGKGIIGAAAATKQNLLVNDTSEDSRYFTADEKIRLSELCVPIIRHDEVLGVINTEHSRKDFYTQRHLQILTTVASLLAEKIEKIKAEQQTYEAEVQLLKINKDLATSQLTALRAQMNPHFIFNALNSVQQYILQGNITEANKYLSKFSKLQREILNYSSQNFIPLQKEIEMLLLYLELEQLRFAKNFTFTITKDAQIDEEEIKIPPMIIQPFIENAIWHGLMPKTGERFVKVNFSLQSDEELICTITDNGIGREAAGRLQQSNGNKTEHKSKGMSLVHDRLNILQAQYGKPFSASISDLVNEEGVAMGTQVELTIHLDF